MKFKLWIEGSKSPIIAYHGTGVQNLQSILSQGLIPNPKKRTWQGSDDFNFSHPSKDSIDGIYLSNNLLTAMLAVNNSKDKLIVICEIMPGHGFADEDTITFATGQLKSEPFHNLNEYMVWQLYLAYKLGDNQEFVETQKRKHIDSVIKGIQKKLKEPMNPNLVARLIELLDEGFYISLERQASHVYHDYKPKVEPPNKIEAELKYRNFMDKITRTLKSLSNPTKRDFSYGVNFRIMEPIRYSGSNKIVGIVIEPADHKEKPKVIYPKNKVLPDQFIKDWEESIGPWKG